VSNVISFDIGTTHTKALLVDKTGKILGSASKEYRITYPNVGWAEQDPRIWWDAVCDVSNDLYSRYHGRFKDIGMIGLSGQMHGAVFLDANKNVIRPALLWCDSRTSKEVEQMRTVLTDNIVKTVLSNPILAGLTATKVLWLRNNEPEHYSKVKTLLLPKDYIRFLLTGTIGTDVSDASGTLFFNVKKGQWSAKVLELLGVNPEMLPPVRSSMSVAGTVINKAAEQLHIPADTPVIYGGGDAVMATVGNGVTAPGKALSVLGTGGNVTIFSDDPFADPKLSMNIFCNVIPGKWIRIGVQNYAGNSLRWLRDGLLLFEKLLFEEKERNPYEVLTSQATQIEPGSKGLLFLPYFMGERTPHMDPYARGVLFGLSGIHTRQHIVRAVMEGVIFSFRDTIELVRKMKVPVYSVRAAGGGARSPLWLQMQADIFNCPVETVKGSPGSGYGAALAAAVSLGLFSTIAEAVAINIHTDRVYTPDKKNTLIYNELFHEYQELYRSLKNNFYRMHKRMKNVEHIVAKY
jgi:xylulokinase